MFQIEPNNNKFKLKPQEGKRKSAAAHKLCVCLVFVAFGFACSCSISDCSDRVLFEVPSPDRHTIVTVFERDCGATTAKNIQIALRENGSPFNSKKNSNFCIYEGETNVFVFWKSATNLNLKIPPNSKLFKKIAEINGMRIEYR